MVPYNVLWTFLLYSLFYTGKNLVTSTPNEDDRPDVTKLRLLNLDATNEYVVMDEDRYEVSREFMNTRTKFTFKDGVRCTGLRYGGDLVWVHNTSQHQNQYPRSVTLDSTVKTLYLTFDVLDFYTFHYKQNKWVFCKELSFGKSNSYVAPATEVTQTSETSVTADGGEPVPDVKSEVADEGVDTPTDEHKERLKCALDSLKKAYEHDLEEAEAVKSRLDKLKARATRLEDKVNALLNVTGEDKRPDSLGANAYDLKNAVKKLHDLVENLQSSPSFDPVDKAGEVDRLYADVVVKFHTLNDEWAKQYGRTEGDKQDTEPTPHVPTHKPETKPESFTPPKPLELDLNETEDNERFECRKDANVSTFTPKNRHFFTKVKLGDNVVWTAGPGESSTKVKVRSYGEDKSMLVSLNNGDFFFRNLKPTCPHSTSQGDTVYTAKPVKEPVEPKDVDKVEPVKHGDETKVDDPVTAHDTVPESKPEAETKVETKVEEAVSVAEHEKTVEPDEPKVPEPKVEEPVTEVEEAVKTVEHEKPSETTEVPKVEVTEHEKADESVKSEHVYETKVEEAETVTVPDVEKPKVEETVETKVTEPETVPEHSQPTEPTVPEVEDKVTESKDDTVKVEEPAVPAGTVEPTVPKAEEHVKVTEPDNSEPEKPEPVEEPKVDADGTNLVELDVTKTESTSEFDYSLEGNDHTFTCKPGHKFSKVKKGDHLLKDLDPPSHKVLANYSQPSKVLLSVYTSDVVFDLLVLNDPDPTTEPPESEQPTVQLLPESRLYADHLKLLTTTAEGTSEELDKSRLDVQDMKTLVNFVFGKNTKCTEVKYENQTVWKYNPAEHGKYFPTAALLNLATNFVMVESGKYYQYSFSYYNGEWRQVQGYNDANPLSPDKFRLLFLDNNGLAVENKFGFYKTTQGFLDLFKIFKTFKCVHVQYNGETVWQHSLREHGDKYPTEVSVNHGQSSVTVESGNDYRYVYTYYKGEFTCNLAYKPEASKPADLEKFKVFTMDDTGLVKDDPNNYTKRDSNGVLTFRLKPNARCVKVMYNDVEVWKHDHTEYEDEYPTSVSYNTKRNNLTVESSYSYRFMYTFSEDKWTQVPMGFKKTELDHDNLKLYKGTDLESLVPLEDDDFEAELDGHMFTVKLKDGVQCSQVKYDNVDVWSHTRKEHEGFYPTTVALNKKKSHLMVESGFDYRYLYGYLNKVWKPLPYGFKLKSGAARVKLVDTAKFKFYSLDYDGNPVEMKQASFRSEENDTLFKVKFEDEVKCSLVQYNNKDVWKYDQNEHLGFYPTTLLFQHGKNHLMVESGYHYRYLFAYQTMQWVSLPFGFKAKKSDDKRLTETEEQLELDKLKLLVLDSSNNEVEGTDNEFVKTEQGLVTKFKFNDGVKCVGVKYDDVDVWKYNETLDKQNYPLEVVFNKQKSLVFVDAGKHYQFLYSYFKKTWTQGYGYRPPEKKTEPETESADQSHHGDGEGSTDSTDGTHTTVVTTPDGTEEGKGSDPGSLRGS